MLDEAAVNTLLESVAAIAAAVKPRRLAYHIATVSTGATLTNYRVRIPPTKYLRVVGWPTSLATLTVRIGAETNPALDILNCGAGIRAEEEFNELFITTDAAAAGEVITFVCGNVEIIGEMQYAAGGVAAAGNGIYPTWTKETGGAPVAAGTAAHTNVTASGTTLVALAANANRVYALFQNDDDADPAWLKVGAAAVANEGIRLDPHGHYEITNVNPSQAAVQVITAGATTAKILVTEIT